MESCFSATSILAGLKFLFAFEKLPCFGICEVDDNVMWMLTLNCVSWSWICNTHEMSSQLMFFTVPFFCCVSFSFRLQLFFGEKWFSEDKSVSRTRVWKLMEYFFWVISFAFYISCVSFTTDSSFGKSIWSFRIFQFCLNAWALRGWAVDRRKMLTHVTTLRSLN